MPLTDEGKAMLARLEEAEASGLQPTERGKALLDRLRQARAAEGGTIETPSTSTLKEPAPSLSPTAQYSEPKGRMATTEDIENSLPLIGGAGLSMLAGPAIIPAAGLAAAGGLAGKSAQMLVRAARTGEAPKSPVKEALTSGVKEGAGALIGGAVFKALGSVAEKTGERFAKPVYRYIVGKLKGVNRSVVENAFNAAEDAAPSVAEAGKDFLEKVAGIKRTASAAVKSTEQAGEAAVSAARAAGTPAEEASLAAARLKPVAGLQPSEVAESASHFSDAFNADISKAYDAAISRASKTRLVPTDELLRSANNIEREFMVGDVVAGKQSKEAITAINEWKDALLRLSGPEAKGIPEDVALDLIKKLGKNTSWDGTASKEAVAALRSLRGQWREVLGAQNKQLGAELRAIAEKIHAKEAFDDAFGLVYRPGFGTSPTDATYTAVESVVKGKRPVTAAAGERIPGFRERLKSAFSRSSQEGEREAAISAAEQKLKEASAARDLAVRAEEKSAQKANMAASRFANVERPGLLDLRRAAETAATAGGGSPAEQALVEMLEPYLGREAGAAATKIIVGASKEMMGRRPASSVAGRILGKVLSPEAERLIAAISKSILRGTTRAAIPLGAAAGAVEDQNAE